MDNEVVIKKFRALREELEGTREVLCFFFGSRYEDKIAPSKKILEKIVQEKGIAPYLAAYFYLGKIGNRISPLEKQFVIVASLELEEEREVASRRSSVDGEEVNTDNCQLKTDDCIYPGGEML